jgi:ArsR family transcriptional regulator
VAVVSPVAGPSFADVDPALEAMRMLCAGHRMQIVQLLADRESCVGDLIAALALPQPLVSYHLRRLREMGVVRRRRHAQWIFYSLDLAGWERLIQPMRAIVEVELSPRARYGASETCGASDKVE